MIVQTAAKGFLLEDEISFNLAPFILARALTLPSPSDCLLWVPESGTFSRLSLPLTSTQPGC